jgi:hypothetical protein
VLPTNERCPAGACRFPATSPYHPLLLPIGGSLLDEASSRIHSHSPVRSSPACKPRMEQGSLGLLPQASHPAVTHDARRGGDRPCTLVRAYTFDINRTSSAITTQLKRPHVAIAQCNSAPGPTTTRRSCTGPRHRRERSWSGIRPRNTPTCCWAAPSSGKAGTPKPYRTYGSPKP